MLTQFGRFGADSTLMLPRYINITRGQFLGLVLAWAVNPWKILASAQTFTDFLGGYIIVSDNFHELLLCIDTVPFHKSAY